MVNSSSQRSGGAGQRVHRKWLNGRVHELHDCHSIFPDYIRPGDAGIQHDMSAVVPGAAR